VSCLLSALGLVTATPRLSNVVTAPAEHILPRTDHTPRHLDASRRPAPGCANAESP
jgi:hypothetical protein